MLSPMSIASAYETDTVSIGYTGDAYYMALFDTTGENELSVVYSFLYFFNAEKELPGLTSYFNKIIDKEKGNVTYNDIYQLKNEIPIPETYPSPSSQDIIIHGIISKVYYSNGEYYMKLCFKDMPGYETYIYDWHLFGSSAEIPKLTSYLNGLLKNKKVTATDDGGIIGIPTKLTILK